MNVSHVPVSLRKKKERPGERKKLLPSWGLTGYPTDFVKSHTGNPALKTTLPFRLLRGWAPTTSLSPRALAHSRPSGSFIGNNSKHKGSLPRCSCQQIPHHHEYTNYIKLIVSKTRNVLENILSPLGRLTGPRHKGCSQWGQNSNGGAPGRGLEEERGGAP